MNIRFIYGDLWVVFPLTLPLYWVQLKVNIFFLLQTKSFLRNVVSMYDRNKKILRGRTLNFCTRTNILLADGQYFPRNMCLPELRYVQNAAKKKHPIRTYKLPKQTPYIPHTNCKNKHPIHTYKLPQQTYYTHVQTAATPYIHVQTAARDTLITLTN